MKAIEISQNFPMIGELEIDESYIGGKNDKSFRGNDGKKKIMSVKIEKSAGAVGRQW